MSYLESTGVDYGSGGWCKQAAGASVLSCSLSKRRKSVRVRGWRESFEIMSSRHDMVIAAVVA